MSVFCIKSAITLYKDENRWLEKQNKCAKLIESTYDSKILGKQLISKILEVESNIESHRLENFTGAMLKHHTMTSTKYMSQWISAKNLNKIDDNLAKNEK